MSAASPNVHPAQAAGANGIGTARVETVSGQPRRRSAEQVVVGLHVDGQRVGADRHAIGGGCHRHPQAVGNELLDGERGRPERVGVVAGQADVDRPVAGRQVGRQRNVDRRRAVGVEQGRDRPPVVQVGPAEPPADGKRRLDRHVAGLADDGPQADGLARPVDAAIGVDERRVAGAEVRPAGGVEVAGVPGGLTKVEPRQVGRRRPGGGPRRSCGGVGEQHGDGLAGPRGGCRSVGAKPSASVTAELTS